MSASDTDTFWGVLDRAGSGLLSTGSSVLEGAGQLANKYRNYFGGGSNDGTATAKPENTTDKRAELNRSAPAEELGSLAWYQQPGYALAVAVGVVGIVLLLSRLK